MSVEVTPGISYTPEVRWEVKANDRVWLLAGPRVGKVVRAPSTLICPPVAEVEIDKVWLELVTGVAPSVWVLLPETRLVGLAMRAIPLTIRVDKVTVLEGNPALFVDPGAGVLVVACGNKAVSVPSTAIEMAGGSREKV